MVLAALSIKQLNGGLAITTDMIVGGLHQCIGGGAITTDMIVGGLHRCIGGGAITSWGSTSVIGGTDIAVVQRMTCHTSNMLHVPNR